MTRQSPRRGSGDSSRSLSTARWCPPSCQAWSSSHSRTVGIGRSASSRTRSLPLHAGPNRAIDDVVLNAGLAQSETSAQLTQSGAAVGALDTRPSRRGSTNGSCWPRSSSRAERPRSISSATRCCRSPTCAARGPSPRARGYDDASLEWHLIGVLEAVCPRGPSHHRRVPGARWTPRSTKSAGGSDRPSWAATSIRSARATASTGCFSVTSTRRGPSQWQTHLHQRRHVVGCLRRSKGRSSPRPSRAWFLPRQRKGSSSASTSGGAC